MSREIDERIVEMQFDNRQFETGVAQTIRSLDRLNDTLKFEGLGGSLRGVQNSISQLDFSSVANGLESLENSLTSFTGRLKIQVFDRLATYATNAGEKIFNALTIGGAKSGMAEYETQMGAVQTILANTQHLGTTIDDVNGALSNLNEYADLTIYNFSEMTRNIGTFTAAGLDLETSTSAIKGIANLAAISGSTSAQASNAMYQLSQALSAGRVSLQDWNSVVNAGMGGKVFQDALKRTAKHMGIVVDETMSFRDSISTKDGNGWLTADVLSETLKQLSGDLDEATLKSQGWSDSEIADITKMAQTATDAATVVKTFGQLTDTVSEQIGSGWTRTFQLIFGDFEESKALWTSVYKAISPYIDAMSDLRNSYLEFWKENEGRDKVLEAFSNIWSGLTDAIGRFSDTLHKIFPGLDTFGEKLVNMSDKFLAFSERFKSTEKVAKSAAKATTKMVSSISDAEKAAAKAIWNTGKYGNGEERVKNLEAEGLSYKNVQGYLEALIESDFDAAKADEKFMVSVTETTEAVEELSNQKTPTILDTFVKIFGNIVSVAKNVITDIHRVNDAISDGFRQAINFTEIISRVGVITDRIKNLSDMLRVTDSALSKITRISRGVYSIFKIMGDVIYGVGTALFDIFEKLFPSLSTAGGNILETAASLGDLIYNFANTHDIATIVHDAIMTIVSVFESLPKRIKAAKDALLNFFDSVSQKIKDSTGIDIKGILSGIRDAFSSLFDKISSITGINIPGIFSGLLSGLKTVAIDIIHLDFKGAFTTIVNAFVSFKNALKARVDAIDPESLFGKFISGMRTVVTTISGLFRNLFSKDEENTVTDNVENKFDFFEWVGDTLSTIGTNLSKVFSFIGELFSELFGFIGGMLTDGIDENDSAFEKVKKVLHNIGSIAKEIFTIIAPFAGLGMAKDLTAMPAAVAGFIDSASGIMDSISNRIGGGDSVFDIIEKMINSLLKLALAVILFAAMKPEKVATATAAMTFLIGELIGSLIVMQKYLKSDIDSALITVAMSKIAGAILKLTMSVVILSLLKPAKVAVAVGAITVMIGELVGAMIAMQKWLKADVDFALVTKTFSKIANTVGMLAVITAILSHKDPVKLAAAVGAVTILMYAIVGVLAILQKSYNPAMGQDAMKNIGYIAALSLTLAQAAKMLVDPVEQLGEMDPKKMAFGLLGLTSIVGLLAGVIVLLGKIKIDDNALKIALSLAVATLAIKTLSKSATELGSEGGDKVLAGIGGIYAMVGALGALVGLMVLISKATSPAKILSMSGALLAAVLALSSLVPVMVILGNLDPSKLAISLVGLGSAMLILIGALALLNVVGGANVLMISGALLLLASALSLVTPSLMIIGSIVVPILQKLVKTDWNKIGKGMAIIGIGLLAMVVAAPVLILFAIGLTAVGAALTLIGVAMTIGARAVKRFADALEKIGEVWPKVNGIFPSLGKQLGAGIVSLLTSIIGGFGEVLTKIRELAPEMALTVKTILLTILTSISELTGAFANFITGLIIQTLTTINTDLPVILSLIGSIVDTFLAWVGTKAGDWTEALIIIAMDVLIGIINGISARIGEIVNAVFGLIISFFNALATTISTRGGELLLSIWNVIVSILGLIWTGFVSTFKFFEGVGGDVLEKIGDGIGGAVFDLVEAVKKVFTEDIPNGVKNAFNKIKELGGKIITSLKDGMVEKAKAIWDAGEDLGEWVYDAINGELEVESPSKKTYETGEYVVEGLVNGVNDSAPGATAACTTLGGNMMGAFGTSTSGAEIYGSNMITDATNGVTANSSALSDATGLAGQDALNSFMTNFNDNANMEFTPTMTITPDANIDWTNVDEAFKSPKDMFADKLSSKGNFSSSFDISAMLGQQNAELDAQRHADAEKNSAEISKLNDAITALTDKWQGGIINIPENATFSVPVNVDGQTIANVAAPYLDVISGDKMNLERAGATSR